MVPYSVRVATQAYAQVRGAFVEGEAFLQRTAIELRAQAPTEELVQQMSPRPSFEPNPNGVGSDMISGAPPLDLIQRHQG